MTVLSYGVPVAGTDLNSTADPMISTALNTILTWSSNIDAINLSAALAQSAGANQSGQTVKGATNISASESRTNVAYGTLTTPDQVTGIVLPPNGLITVWYQALWQESVSGAARAAIFVGANQLQVQQTITSRGPATQAASTNGSSAGIAQPLLTIGSGLASVQHNTGGSFSADITTGQVVGYLESNPTISVETSGTAFGGLSTGNTGPCYIFAAAGTYTISVQFKASSGSVTASSRKLWVEAKSFS